MIWATLYANTSGTADVGKDVRLATVAQRKLGVVGVSREVFETMTASSQKSEGFVPLVLIASTCIA